MVVEFLAKISPNNNKATHSAFKATTLLIPQVKVLNLEFGTYILNFENIATTGVAVHF